MEQTTTLLQGSSDTDKSAYLSAIASLATADRQATSEEIEYLQALCDAAELSQEQSQEVVDSANDLSGSNLQQNLDILKSSDLKYSLITDLITFANSDNNYSETEHQHVQEMANYLGVDQQQYAVLNSVAEKVAQSQSTPEEVNKPNFLSSLGLGDKLQGAGINGGSLLKGLIGLAGPLILSKMLSGGRRSGGMFGGSGGGMFGGGGGLGSLIGMLSGGRGMGSMGGLLGGLLGGSR